MFRSLCTKHLSSCINWKKFIKSIAWSKHTHIYIDINANAYVINIFVESRIVAGIKIKHARKRVLPRNSAVFVLKKISRGWTGCRFKWPVRYLRKQYLHQSTCKRPGHKTRTPNLFTPPWKVPPLCSGNLMELAWPTDHVVRSLCPKAIEASTYIQ